MKYDKYCLNEYLDYNVAVNIWFIAIPFLISR